MGRVRCSRDVLRRSENSRLVSPPNVATKHHTHSKGACIVSYSGGTRSLRPILVHDNKVLYTGWWTWSGLITPDRATQQRPYRGSLFHGLLRVNQWHPLIHRQQNKDLLMLGSGAHYGLRITRAGATKLPVIRENMATICILMRPSVPRPRFNILQ